MKSKGYSPFSLMQKNTQKPIYFGSRTTGYLSQLISKAQETILSFLLKNLKEDKKIVEILKGNIFIFFLLFDFYTFIFFLHFL